MTDVLGISELSMINDMRQLDMISHNIANATTHGYKRDISVSRSFADQFDIGFESLSRNLAAIDNTVPTMSSAIDYTQGAFTKTGNPLDVAIEGEGFFEFNAGDRLIYSRHGSFQMDSSGRLVSAGNLAVNGLSGEIRLATNNPRIDAQGMIWDGEDAIGQLKVVKFNDLSALVKVGNSGYEPGASRPESIIRPSLRQGFLETSNVEIVDEMVKMMTTVRHFEATQHVIQGFDDVMSTAIQTIAEF